MRRGTVSGLDVAQVADHGRTGARRHRTLRGQCRPRYRRLDAAGRDLHRSRIAARAIRFQQPWGSSRLPAGVPSGRPAAPAPTSLEAEHTLRAANADIGAARAAFFPDITLTANLGLGEQSTVEPLQVGHRRLGLRAADVPAHLPRRCADGGTGLSRTSTGRSPLAQYEKAIQSGFFVKWPIALALTATLESPGARPRRPWSKQPARLTNSRSGATRSAATAISRCSIPQRSDYAARQGLITAHLAEQSNRVTLYKALGGGWREQSPMSMDRPIRPPLVAPETLACNGALPPSSWWLSSPPVPSSLGNSGARHPYRRRKRRHRPPLPKERSMTLFRSAGKSRCP